MPASTRLFLFPDVNVWVALTYEGHVHHRIAVRNEMVHPVPLPTGTGDDCPTHLRHLKQTGLLESTGEATDCRFMEQLASHRLFDWSCRVTRDLFQCVVNSN